MSGVATTSDPQPAPSRSITGTDAQLLARYVRTGSDEAFAELARRHVNVVYSAALRQLQRHDLAEDVAQTVWLTFARKAPALPEQTILPAWLLVTTRHVCMDVCKSEARRRSRERRAAFFFHSENDAQRSGFELKMGSPFWAIEGGVVTTGGALVRRRWRRRLKWRRHLHGLCPTCGYDVRSSPLPCPECGTPGADATVVARI